MKILIVDDECEIAMLILQMLEAQHTVTATCNPQEALEMIESNMFDIVISDYNMPVISGALVCEVSRKRNPKCFNIIITGYEEHARISDDTIDRVLTKPFSWPKLFAMINEVRVV